MLERLSLHAPGLFITATDTHVGKTVVTSAIAVALRQQRPGLSLGVCKPFATGCRRERETLVNADAEALAHFADCRSPLATINPIRFKPPLAAAVAAEQTGQAVDWAALAESLKRIDRDHDALLIEGVGGLLVPLDPEDMDATVLTLMRAIGYPAVVVTRSGLGTLNHTAMTVRLLREAGVPVAGLVMNNYHADAANADDPSVQTNRPWLERLTGAPVLATAPAVSAHQCRPDQGVLDRDIISAIAMQRWDTLMGP
jgi:dethiobiotin synthetase